MKTPASPDLADLSCRELVVLASDYVEGRLPLHERSRFEMHLCYRAPCRIYLQQIRSTIETTGRLAARARGRGARQ